MDTGFYFYCNGGDFIHSQYRKKTNLILFTGKIVQPNSCFSGIPKMINMEMIVILWGEKNRVKFSMPLMGF